MKKENVLWLILNLIFLIIFNALFFVLGGTEQKASAWLSYVFIHFAYLMLLATPILMRKGKSREIFGFTIYSISTGYFLLQLATGIVFILIALDSINAPLLVQLCLAGLYGVLLIVNLMANERTATAEEHRQRQVSYIKDSAIRLKGVLDKIQDKAVKKKVEKLYDALYASPVRSRPELAQIENHIIQSIGELERAAYNGNHGAVGSLADSLLAAVNERNMRLKTLN